MTPIIETRSLSIGYPGRTVASGIELALPAAKLISVVGANGIGKSTMLRTICGIQPPISGDVTLQGKSIGTYSPAQLAREISLVLTEKPAASNMTVQELVALGRQPYTDWIGTLTQKDREIVSSALEQAGVVELAHRKIGQLSDGQLQKVMVARAVAQDTGIILLDEPSTHLDLMHKLSLFRLLRKLANDGKCIVFSTHDIESAIGISDVMIVMNGKCVEIGKPSELIANGAFDKLFPKSEIAFDPAAVKFIFKGL